MIEKKEISDFIHLLIKKHIGISEIWFIGSRANNENIRPDSDWDFIVFNEMNISEKLSNDIEIKNKAISLNVDLLVENDSEEFVSPWERKRISKKDLRWQKYSKHEAKYLANKCRKRTLEEKACMTEWEKFAVDHGADNSIDISDWMIARKVWPSD